MTRVVALSSQVAFGHVGLSAAGPVLNALSHHMTALPTVLLSNHPGWAHTSGAPVPVAQLERMIDALDANGWLTQHEALLTGYLPSPDHVDLAARLAQRLRAANPSISVIVDPVLGDHPKGLYIPADTASALRDKLVPLADAITPNLFELGWLVGREFTCIEQIKAAALNLCSQTYVTSALADPDETAVLSLSASEQRRFVAPRRHGIPNGVGDVFSALIAAGIPVDQSLGHLHSLIDVSIGAGHLRIVDTANLWVKALPIRSTTWPGL